MLKVSVLAVVLFAVTLQGAISDPEVSAPIKKKPPGEVHVVPVEIHQLAKQSSHDIGQAVHGGHVTVIQPLPKVLNNKPQNTLQKKKRKQKAEFRKASNRLLKRGRKLQKAVKKALKSGKGKVKKVKGKKQNTKVTTLKGAKSLRQLPKLKGSNRRGRLVNRIRSIIGSLQRRQGKGNKKVPTGYLRRVVGIPSRRFKGKNDLKKLKLNEVLKKAGIKQQTLTPKGRKGQPIKVMKKQPRTLTTPRRTKGQRRRGNLAKRIKAIIGSLQRKRKGKKNMPTGYLRRLIGIPSRRFKGRNDLKKLKFDDILRKAGVKRQGNKLTGKKGQPKAIVQKTTRQLVRPGQKGRNQLWNKINSIIRSLKRKERRKQKLPTGYLRKVVGIPSRRFKGKNDLNKLNIDEILKKAGINPASVRQGRTGNKKAKRVNSKLTQTNKIKTAIKK